MLLRGAVDAGPLIRCRDSARGNSLKTLAASGDAAPCPASPGRPPRPRPGRRRCLPKTCTPPRPCATASPPGRAPPTGCARSRTAPGPRLAGSPGDRAAVAVSLEILKAQGFSNVHAEPVTVPVWSRESESGEVVAPVSQKLALTALGGSVATPEGGLEAEVVGTQVRSTSSRRRRTPCAAGSSSTTSGPSARPTAKATARASSTERTARPAPRSTAPPASSSARSAPTTTACRTRAPSTTRRTSRRSRRPRSRFRTPTCSRTCSSGAAPSASGSCSPAAERPDAESANVVGEIQGREKPEEIVLLGAHLDSWDLGTGRDRRRSGLRHRHRGRAPDRRAAAASAAHDPRRPLRQRGERPRGREGLREGARGRARAPRRGARGRRRHGPPPRPLVERRPLGGAALFAQIAGILEPLGAGQLKPEGYGGADISPLLAAGVPTLGLWQDSSTYFDFHHTANDTFDKIDPKDLDRARRPRPSPPGAWRRRPGRSSACRPTSAELRMVRPIRRSPRPCFLRRRPRCASDRSRSPPSDVREARARVHRPRVPEQARAGPRVGRPT